MLVEVNNKEYHVKFKHYNTDVVLNKKGKTRTLGTSCTISLNGKKLSIGESYIHPLDNFNRKMGRKESFRKSLLNSGISKDNRRSFWYAMREKIDI